MKFNTLQSLVIAALSGSVIALTSCEEDAHTPPNVIFKSTSSFTSQDTTVTHIDTLLVGIIADKTEDELKLFNVSVAYDGASTTSSLLTDTLQPAEYDHYDANVQIITRNQAGSEKYSFTITDMDGNITTKYITLTVL